MKTKLLVMLTIAVLTTSFTSINIYAASYEHEYYDVTIDGYVHYGHQIITGDCEVFYCLLDNGINQAFVPIIYTYTEPPAVPVTINTKGSSGQGSTIEEAKLLTDVDAGSKSCFSTVNVTDYIGQTCYIYDTINFNFKRYGVSSTRSALESNSNKYYYNAQYDLNSIDMYKEALKEYLNGNLNDFEIINNEYVEITDSSNVSDVNVLECTSVIVQMIYKVCEVVLQKPFVYFLAIAVIIGLIGIFSKFKNAM